MAGDQSGYQLQFHRSARRNFSDYESLARLFQSRLAPALSLHQLPPDLSSFTGRQAKLDDAIALLKQADLPGRRTPIVLAIAGRAGVGKSALAIHIAHGMRQTFPDAQLYVDLRGSDSQPLRPADVLANFLRAWGVSDAAMPGDLLERSRLFQLFLADKRTLLLLDNAENEAQVRSLIPATGCCAVLVSSRKRLTDLADATLLDLAEMSEIAALELLQKFTSAEVIREETDTSLVAVNLCSRLPIALCTFGSLLQYQPRLSLRDAVCQLSETRKRVKDLHLSHTDIRANFALIYQQLRPITAQLLRRLGLLVEPSFTLAIAAVLLETELEPAREAVQQLINLRLLEAVSGDRYRFVHDLVRLLVRGQLATEESTEARQAARLRVCQWYLEAAELMSLGLEPAFYVEIAQVLSRRSRQSLPTLEQKTIASALYWFETERFNLLTAVEWAHQAEDWKKAIALTENLVSFYDIRKVWVDWEQTHRLALDAARQLSSSEEALTGVLKASRLKEAFILNNLGNAYLRQRQWDRAREHYKQSLELLSLMDSSHEAQTLVNLGILYIQQDQPDKTVSLWSMALGKLPIDTPEQKRLKQWMQGVNKTLLQQAIHHNEDNQPARGLFQSIGNAFKRLIAE